MMWAIQGRPIDPKRIEPFAPVRILSYYDGPRIFTFRDADGALCLAVWSDEDSVHSRFLVVAVSDRTIAELESGLLSVREALDQPRLWVVDYEAATGLTAAWLTTLDDVPADAQPQPRAMLHRSLEPILSLRATGAAIRLGEIPGSVVRATVEGARKAIKCLAEFELDSPARKSRPSRALQRLYDLPVQKTLAASFEVQFRSPLLEPNLFDGLEESEIREEKDVLGRVAEHLHLGLAWLTSSPEAATALPIPSDPELSRAIIKALKFLTPSPRGPIQELEIRGELATKTAGPIRLSRNARSIVNGAMSRIPAAKERRVTLRGRIRELNERLMRFELHFEINSHPSHRNCEFDPELWDEVYEMLGVEIAVEVRGTETGPTSLVRVFDLVRLDTEDTEHRE